MAEQESVQPQRVPAFRFAMPAEPDARASAWSEALAPVFAVSLRADSDLSAPIRLTGYNLGDVIVSDVVAPAHTLERDATQIRGQGLDHLLLQFYRSGHSRVETTERTQAVGASDVVVFDLAQPVRIVAAPVEATNLMIPRPYLETLGIGCAALHGRAFNHDTDPMLRLLHTFLQNIAACGEGLEVQHAADLTQVVVRLCVGALRDKGEARPEGANPAVAVRRFIHRELGRPDLGPAIVCAQFGLSRSALYRLFAAEGGVLSYIRERRLLLAMKLLAQGNPPPRISRLAYSLGFTDEKTFARAFKRRFGFPPSRIALTRDDEATTDPGVAVLLDWMRTLAT